MRPDQATLLLLGVMVPAIGIAGDGPDQVNWNCVDVGSAGLRWSGDTETYRDTSFMLQQHQVVQQRDHLLFPPSLPLQEGYQCGFREGVPVLTCGDGVRSFNLNVQTGYATHSRTYGWMDPYSRPQPMFVAAAVCHRQ